MRMGAISAKEYVNHAFTSPLITDMVTERSLWNGQDFLPNMEGLEEIKDVDRKRWQLVCRAATSDSGD